MGVRTTEAVLAPGGRNDVPSDGEHSHGGRTGGAEGDWIAYDDPGENDDRKSTRQHTHGTHNHQGENRPRFIGVYFIIRIM
jgi:hypothetical protein